MTPPVTGLKRSGDAEVAQVPEVCLRALERREEDK